MATDEQFSGEDFYLFRDRNLVELAVDYAQVCSYWKNESCISILYSKAIGKQLIYYSVTMVTIHSHTGTIVMGSHDPPFTGCLRLAILSNFPETVSPEDYASLLPAVKLVVIPLYGIILWYL